MRRLVKIFGGALLVLIISITGVVDANAQQTGPQNPGQEIVQLRQSFIDGYRAALRRYEINGRSFATQRDCVRLTEVLLNLEDIAYEDPRSAYLIPEKTHNEFTIEAKRLHSELSRIYTSLTGEPCPPDETLPQQSGQGVQTALNVTPWRPQLKIEGGVSSTQNIEDGNGNFNTKLDATGAQFDGTLSVPLPRGFLGANSTFQARFYGFQGSDSQNLSGNAGTFLQANGGNQAINLNITSGESKAEISRIGGEALMLFPSSDPLRHFGAIFSPLFGAGFEHATLDTQTSVQISGINFHATDTRTVKTNTASFIVGVMIENPVLPLRDGSGLSAGFVSTLVELRGSANFNWTDATAVYDTAQVGVFSELLRNEFSRDTVTFSGRVSGGVAYTAPNGSRLALKASVGSVPVHELRFHAGQMATIEHSNHLNLTAGASLTIPFNFRRNTGAPWPFRGVSPLRDWLQEQERRRRSPL